MQSIPLWAYDGSATSPDIYDPQDRTKPSPLCKYPKVGCSCRNPEYNTGHSADPFPVYYTVRRCSDDDVRVSLNLFYQKDGFNYGLKYGHDLSGQLSPLDFREC